MLSGCSIAFWRETTLCRVHTSAVLGMPLYTWLTFWRFGCCLRLLSSLRNWAEYVDITDCQLDSLQLVMASPLFSTWPDGCFLVYIAIAMILVVIFGNGDQSQVADITDALFI